MTQRGRITSYNVCYTKLLRSQYVEHAEGSAALANRIWQAAFEICQAFVAAYRSLLERALDHPADPRWSDALPRLFARLIHFHGTDSYNFV